MPSLPLLRVKSLPLFPDSLSKVQAMLQAEAPEELPRISKKQVTAKVDEQKEKTEAELAKKKAAAQAKVKTTQDSIKATYSI